MSATSLLSSLPACSVRSDAVPSTSGRACQAPPASPYLRSHAGNRTAFGSRGSRGSCQTSRGRLQISCAVKKRTDKHLVCSKTLTIKDGHKDEAVKMCQKIVDFSKEQMQNSKSGILAFECSQDNWEPNVVHFWERYDGNRSMGQHNTTDEYSAFMNGVQEHLTGPVGMVLYEWQNGQIGMSCVHGGPKGEGGLDDATGAGGAGGAGYKQTSDIMNPANIEREETPVKDTWGMGFKFPWQKKQETAKK